MEIPGGGELVLVILYVMAALCESPIGALLVSGLLNSLRCGRAAAWVCSCR